MKRLNVEEIKQFANALSFTDSEANDITDLFFYLKRDTIISIIETQLESVDDYIKEWEDHWHREKNITECYEYERDNEYYEYDEELRENIFASEESFKEYVLDDFVYQLPNNDMVVVVC